MFATVFFGCIIGTLTLGAYLYEPISILMASGQKISIGSIDAVLENPEVYVRAQTFAFTTLGISQLFNAFGFKKLHKSFFSINHLNNPMMIVSFILGLGLQITITEVPVLAGLFYTTKLSLNEWLWLIIICSIPLWAHEIYRIIHNVYTMRKHA